MPKLADDARFNRFHAKVLLWCLLILIIDGYDIAVMGIALPSIMQQMGVNASTAGFMASSALFGMMFGAMVLGTLSDRIGRRWALSIGVMLFSVFTAAAGFTKDPISFSVVRFIAGLGIGGVLPVIVAQMVEYSPKKIRSLMTALMTSGYALGGILAAVLGKQLIGEDGFACSGRLTLADALLYACEQKPDAVVDLATLTGACVIALGDEMAGLWSNNDDLAEALDAAAQTGGEGLWRMPLRQSYRDGLKSLLADMKNTGPRPGGSITAALFLKEFVAKDTAWAHIDIAGPVWSDKGKGVNPAGATGYGVRTLVNWVLAQS